VDERFPHLYLIGLTGNIGCGKSTVVKMLETRGARVIDADAVTRQVMDVGQPAYRQVVETFGNDIVQAAHGPINRPALGRIVFGDSGKLRQLEAIVHPATRQFILNWLHEQNTMAAATYRRQPAVIDAIRLIEAGYPAICDTVWVVTCEEHEQLRRLVQERGMTEQDARQRISAQPPQREKVAVADHVIDNSGTREETEQQVDAAWQTVHRHLGRL
jgi:dephospho-CoA kinase